ncbi:quinone-interacting membrane-bound oxidoreductase complex subunit QmoC [candidate division KSB1 bacterium]
MSETRLIEPDVDFIKKVRGFGGDTLKKCYQCATCSVVCELSEPDHSFPRKEMIWAQWGLGERLLGDPDVWLCHQCNDCTLHCPRGARPGDVLAGIRSYIYEKFSFPGFMGKMLGNPRALPVLLLGPAVMFIIILFLLHGPSLGFRIENLRDIGYSSFLPHIWAEGLFITGNVIIFLFAAVGFVRFWNFMKRNNNGQAPGLVSSLLGILKDVISHSRFGKCGTNKTRYLAHLLVFYGFIGAMITAGLAVFFTTIVEIVPSPIPLLHPIKILGIVSGTAMVAGCGIQISRRINKTDDVGADGYPDRLFLYMLLLVALTGLLTLFIRFIGIPELGYAVYFIHLVFVFFLLWFMPYSKFAHMVYRLLAMAFAKGTAKS